MSIPNANRLSVVFLPKHQQIADDFIFEARNRYPELNIESISLTGQQADVPTGTAVALFFDGAFNADRVAANWLTGWPTSRGAIPLFPIAIDPQAQRPPNPIAGIKSRVWPLDKDELLTTVGASLGMTLRPGKQKLFISYRQSDGTDVAQRIYNELTFLGFNAWLDVADDRYGDPRLEIGDHVQKEIMGRLADASAMIQVDTPSAPQSPWVCAEVETAVGQMIPILPVVLHDDSAQSQPSRFRELNGLHRRVCIQSKKNGDQFQVTDAEVSVIVRELSDYLTRIYIRRVIQPRMLERAFTASKWRFDKHADKPHLHQASFGPPPPVPLSLLGCCSFEDSFFAPTCQAFLDDIATLAGNGQNFVRSLYFYDGDVLYDRSIQYIVNNEVPRLQQGNVDLVAYNEAVARVLKIAGGLSGIFA